MIHNALLLSTDPPTDAPCCRCALTAPTASEMEWLAVAGLIASAVMYILIGEAMATPLAAGSIITVKLDSGGEQSWTVIHVNERVGEVIRYRQVFLSPPP